VVRVEVCRGCRNSLVPSAGAENEAVEQVAFADRLVLNKTDLVEEADLKRVEGRTGAARNVSPLGACRRTN